MARVKKWMMMRFEKISLLVMAIVLAILQAPLVTSAASPQHVVVSTSCASSSSPCSVTSQTILPDGSIIVVAKLLSASSSKIGSVTLVISPLAHSNGKYHNTQTTTVKSTAGALMNEVAVTMFENCGCIGGYFHGLTGHSKYPTGETIERDTYPGPGSYTEWSSAALNGQTVLSVKITVIVP